MRKCRNRGEKKGGGRIKNKIKQSHFYWSLTSLPVDRQNTNRLQRQPLVPKVSSKITVQDTVLANKNIAQKIYLWVQKMCCLKTLICELMLFELCDLVGSSLIRSFFSAASIFLQIFQLFYSVIHHTR